MELLNWLKEGLNTQVQGLVESWDTRPNEGCNEKSDIEFKSAKANFIEQMCSLMLGDYNIDNGK